MHGGFVGVDVFFVISGFLITTHIAARVHAGTFSARDFYARRILRIFPLLLLVTAVTLLCSRFFPLLPRELRELGQAAAATAAMVSNYYFMTTESFEYFAVRSETQPLLHTWTLGIEEQYYLLAPWIIIAIVAFGVRRRWPSLEFLLIASAAICVLSFAAMLIIGVAIQTPTAGRFEFYSLLTRAWQFGVGGTLAIAILNGWSPPAKFQLAAGVIGLAAIVVAVLSYDERTIYPGTAALLPTIGAALVLSAGHLNGTSLPVRILSTPPAVAIGLLSYGWYLWHWPLLAFTRSVDPEQGIWRSLAVSIVALALAALTYLCLERPMKRLRQSEFPERYGVWVIASGLGVSACLAIVALASMRDPGTEPSLAMRRAGSLPLSTNYCRDEQGLPRFPGIPTCKVGNPGDPVALVLGDSHAMRLSGIAEWAGNSTLVAAQPGCPALLNVGFDDRRQSEHCGERLEAIRRWLQSEQASSIRGVMLSARWALYSGEGTASRSERRFPTLRFHDRRRGGDFHSILSESLGDLLTMLQQLGHRTLIVGPIPELRQAAADCLLRAQIYQGPRDRCAISRAAADKRYHEVIQTLQAVAAKFPNVRLIDAVTVFCDAEYCRPFDDDGLLYSDTNHLTTLGVEKLYRRYEGEFRWVFDGAPSGH